MGFWFWINNKRNLRRALYILLIGWLFRSLTLWLLFRVLRTSSQVFEGELYQLWTPNCSNPEVAHDKWINIEITSFCNIFCPTFWLLKIPTLRSSNQFLWFFFKVFFVFVFCNHKLSLLTSSSGYQEKNWLFKNCIFIPNSKGSQKINTN